MATNTSATSQNHNGTGSQANFAISFPFLLNSEIEVSVGGVLKTLGTHYNIVGSEVQFTSGNIPASGTANIVFNRDTNISTKRVDFEDGSVLTEADLDNNVNQVLFAQQELSNDYVKRDGTQTVTGNLVFEGSADDANETTLAITNPTADRTITVPDVTGTIVTTGDTGTVTSTMINDGTIVNADVNASAAIDGTKISPNFGSQNIVTSGTVDGRDVSVDGSKLDGIESGATADQTASEIRTLVESASDSNVFTDADHSKLNGIEAGATADQTAAEIRTLVESASDSNVFTDADHSKLNGIESGATADQTASEIKSLIASSPLDASHLAANSVDTSEIASGAIDSTKLNANTVVTNSEQASASVNDTSFFTTSASDARYFNISSGDTIKDGQSFPDNDTTIATTAAINDRIIDLVDDVGGFVPIANETSFPTANPDVNNGTGTIVSVATASTNLTPSGTTVTIANGAGSGNTVTITGVPSVISSGFGFLVETTTTLHTYTFHRLTPKATEVTTVATNATQVQTVHNNITQVQTVHNNISDIQAVAADASDIGAVAGKATEIGRLGTADAVADMALLGTTDVVADMNLLATSDVISDMNTLAVADVISDMNTLAVADVISDMNDLATSGNITAMSTCSTNIASINNASSNISSVNNFGDKYQVASSDPSTDGGGNALAAGDLYFNTSANELKVYTGSAWQGGVTATGNFATVTGNTFTGDNKYIDNVKLNLGTGADLQLFHSGTNSYIQDNGTGALYIGSNNTSGAGVLIRGRHGEESIIANSNGSVDLYFDNSKKLETTDTGISVTGIGAIDNTSSTSDIGLRINHNATSAFSTSENIEGTTNKKLTPLMLRNGGASSNTETYLGFDAGNTSKAQWNIGIKKTGSMAGDFIFNTRTGSATSAQRLKITHGGDLVIPTDNAKLQIGESQDLQLYHTGSANHIDSVNGALAIRSDVFQISTLDGTHVYLNIPTDEQGVELYYDNSKKLETTSAGISVTGTSTFGGSLIMGADNSYDIGSGAARVRNMFMYQTLDFLDTGKIQMGNSDDLQIYHNGSNSFLDNATGGLYLRNSASNGQMLLRANGNILISNYAADEYRIKTFNNGAVELYYDNSKKLETTSSGVTVTGGVTATAFSVGDNQEIKLGAGNDLKLFHNGNHSYIADVGTGDLRITGSAIHLQNAAQSENMIRTFQDGAVELYYDNSKKFETVTGGANVTGALGINTTSPASTIDARAASGATITARNTGTVASIAISVGSSTNQLVSRGVNSSTARDMIFMQGTTTTTRLDSNGHFRPETNNTYDLGTTSYRWANVYTNDLNLSNEGGANDVDGTWGSYTIQEGAEDLFLINKRNGKKYKFALAEVA